MEKQDDSNLKERLKKAEEQIDWLKFQNKIMRAFLIGLAFLVLRFFFAVRGVGAVSLPSSSGDSGRFVGFFTDELTGVEFELYDHTVNSDLDPIENYYSNLIANSSSDSDLVKRGWVDCQNLKTTIQRACCHTAHGLGKAAMDLGAAAMGAFINDEIQNAFANGRGGKSPRSICHTYDGDNVCTSWANYDSNGLKNGESADIANFATSCAKRGYSSEFKGTDSNGGTIFICISNRATGCGASTG